MEIDMKKIPFDLSKWLADLIRKDFQPLYRKLGRDKFIEVLKAHPEISSPKQMSKVLEEEQK